MNSAISRPATRLALPEVTLCAVTSVNVDATIMAMQACIRQIEFGACILLTDGDPVVEAAEIQVRQIGKIDSSADYSRFLLRNLVRYIETSHVMIVQWDGHVIASSNWRSDMTEYDYIGARWPQFKDGHDVGNGGFSLRSKRLLEACVHPSFHVQHPEDVAIGRINRTWLEMMGMRFAPSALADLYSAERAGDVRTSFGFHGVFNMPEAVGVAKFWEVYQLLDDRRTIWRDFFPILRSVAKGRGAGRRVIRLVSHYCRYKWDRFWQ